MDPELIGGSSSRLSDIFERSHELARVYCYEIIEMMLMIVREEKKRKAGVEDPGSDVDRDSMLREKRLKVEQ